MGNSHASTINHAPAVRKARAALETEPRVQFRRYPVDISLDAESLVLEGEAPSIAAKKLALRLAAGVGSIRGVVDRLRVAPAEHRGDGAIRDSLVGLLLQAPELRQCSIRAWVKGAIETARECTDPAGGEIVIAIQDAVVTLEGTVLSLAHKRITGVLAWWTPGCRDVVNALGVQPEQVDDDGELLDALGLVIEMDPLVRGDLIELRCENRVITLGGAVATALERDQVERDAWALFGVDDVRNQITVRAAARPV